MLLHFAMLSDGSSLTGKTTIAGSKPIFSKDQNLYLAFAKISYITCLFYLFKLIHSFNCFHLTQYDFPIHFHKICLFQNKRFHKSNCYQVFILFFKPIKRIGLNVIYIQLLPILSQEKQHVTKMDMPHNKTNLSTTYRVFI